MDSPFWYLQKSELDECGGFLRTGIGIEYERQNGVPGSNETLPPQKDWFVLISSIVAKRIEYKRSRQEYLAKKREEPYGQFVDMVYKIQQNTKKGGSYTEAQMLEDLSQFSKQITLWGSSRVVNKWVKFRENGTNPELAQKNLLLLEDIMNEMRKDLGLRKTKKGNLLAFFVNDIKKAIKSMK